MSVWNSLNISKVNAYIHLNDLNRKPFSTETDDRLEIFESFAEAISNMPGGKGYSRNKSLTTETRDALFQTSLCTNRQISN